MDNAKKIMLQKLGLQAAALEENECWKRIVVAVQEEIEGLRERMGEHSYGSPKHQEIYSEAEGWKKCLQYMKEKIKNTKSEGVKK